MIYLLKREPFISVFTKLRKYVSHHNLAEKAI